MKAIVLETKKNTAAVLREDGVVLQVRGHYTVDETIELKEKPEFSFTFPRMRMAVAAAAIVMGLLFGGVYNYTTVQAAGYVTVNEEIGLELVLNRRNQVIEIRATDEAGEAIRTELESRNIRGASLEDAVYAVNEIHYREMKEKEPDREPEELTFYAVSGDERRQEQLNRELEHIHEEGKPREGAPVSTAIPEQPAEPEAGKKTEPEIVQPSPAEMPGNGPGAPAGDIRLEGELKPDEGSKPDGEMPDHDNNADPCQETH